MTNAPDTDRRVGRRQAPPAIEARRTGGRGGRAGAAAMAVVVAGGGPGCQPAFRDCAPISPRVVAQVPDRLSATGLYRDPRSEALADGVRPFTPRFASWSDGATKRRWIYLPPRTQIDTRDPDAWNFPVGT